MGSFMIKAKERTMIITKIQFASGQIVEARGPIEICFVSWLNDLKFSYEGVHLRPQKGGTSLTVKSASKTPFKASAFTPDNAEHEADTLENLRQLVQELRFNFPDHSIFIKLWHWTTRIATPPLDPEFLQEPAYDLRRRQLRVWANLAARAKKNTGALMSQGMLLRGILDAIIFAGIDLSHAKTEYEVRNAVLRGFGKEPPPLPEPWQNEVVLQFVDGGAVIPVTKRELPRFHSMLAQEIDRRRVLDLSQDGFLRHRRADDTLLQSF